MEYQDRATIGTPEAVELEFVLAGVGSRGIAAAIDFGIQFSLLFGIFIVASPLAALGGDALTIIVFSLATFFMLYVFDVLFEAFRGGQTPGMQVIGLRVIRDGGEPVDLRSAAIRNIVLLVDGPLTLWGAGITSIVLSKENKRLGDMAAGTLVIRERFPAEPPPPPPPRPGLPPPPPPPDLSAGWDVGAVTAADMTVVRRFMIRRFDLKPEPRARVAGEIASRLHGKVAGPVTPMGDEAFLEQLVRAYDRR
ncbi:MAG: RDD family protein [Solirubrobacterales bacterium]|nr:RDD family protein [Solirubrobacterales bacterium]MCB8970246.1 RDD family protein [Thermoleophilales bacterium]MCO5327850.1 RDD family protein [Solirubrobacterales bacterium]